MVFILNISLFPQSSPCTCTLSIYILIPQSLSKENTVSGWLFLLILRHIKGKYGKAREINFYSFPIWLLQSKLQENIVSISVHCISACLSLTLLRIKCSPCPQPKWKYDLMFVYCVDFVFPRSIGCKFWFTDVTCSHRNSLGRLLEAYPSAAESLR